MNIYEAIFVRRSVHSYRMEAISNATLESIQNYHREVQGLFGKIDTEVSIVDNCRSQHKILGLFGIKAPYYLLIYSEEGEKAAMNVGYIMQQIVLHICSNGLGSCIVNPTTAKKSLQRRNGKQLYGVVAFGKSSGAYLRKVTEARRLDMARLCVYKDKPRLWMKQLLEAARMAPSSLNSQPWRFVVYDNRLHIFSKSRNGDKMKMLDEINFGIMFANMIVVAEELWLDVDLITLEEIAQKTFPNNRYVLSAILRL